MEPESTEDSFMRFMRLPVIVTSVSRNHPADTTAVNADGQSPSTVEEETEVTRVMMLPVFLYGLRTNTSHPPPHPPQQQETTQPESTHETPPRRQSARIRERVEREQQQQQQQARGLGTGQWTVYIISGNSVENMMNDSPSYEELLDLATFIGPARRPTVSQEAIDSHVPLLKYTQQVKQTMLGNAEGCQVCLNNYQSEEDVRVLDCHHGFHKECIDKWLTEGQNKCPLCRHQPVPTS
ncbi:hypothetical protein CU098_006285 [Rhizopus stolonifer]|uniref:RING-type E3 ubiquitin transferase n=1 Tax=Rhizopus stolonifer TaxID=4846 RepID=A0A367ILZ2_RHIST|nr:hypothetical protein CU098_006285 [Rhizopus stolonifer]